MVIRGEEEEGLRSKAGYMTELGWRNSEPEAKNFKDSERVIE